MNLSSTFGRAVAERIQLFGSLGREPHAEEREARSSRELQRVLVLPPEMIVTISSDGLFKTANPACEALLGYKSEELVGQRYVDLVHSDDRDRSAMSITTLT